MDSRRDDQDVNLRLGQCDTDEDGQWLSYRQLAEKRGVTLRAVMRQAQRQKLRRQPGNDGKTLVWVPRDMVAGTGRTDRPVARSDRAADVAVAVAALERAHERELRAKDELITGLRRDVAEARAAATRAELALGTAQEALRQAEAREMARKARGRWARLRAAWLGR